jgi:hypothetical protein
VVDNFSNVVDVDVEILRNSRKKLPASPEDSTFTRADFLTTTD